MPTPPDDPLATFLEYYGKYWDAKQANQPIKTWLLAIHCRSQLQKMGDHSKEAEICENIFAAFVGKEQAVQIYRDLRDDSRSYPQQQGK
jgi:hypothetical protein